MNHRAFARLLSFVAAVMLIGFALPAQAQLAHMDEQVSSDGSNPPSSREASRPFIAADPGAPGSLAPLTEAEIRATGAKPATADFHRKVRTYKPIRGEARPESVIGADGRTQVTDTTTFPARAVVIITFDTPGGGAFCSGWLVNRNTVVTAGHCVSAGNGTMYNKATYELAAAYNSAAGMPAPYGTCGAKTLYTNKTWKNTANDQYDYAAIKLDCTLPKKLGAFGYSKTVAANDNATVQGYPGDKTFGTHWKMKGKVTVLQARRVFYNMDTYGGQSGSPVWKNNGASCKYCGIAIHAYGTYGSPPFSNNNHGTRIIQAVFDNITTWKNAP